MDKPRNNFLLFLAVLLLELGCLLHLVMAHRMVIGHDGFELFCHQWFFLNSAVSHHQWPLWSPYLSQGTPVWWYFIYSRMDIFSNAVMAVAPWIKHGNFLGFFYGSLFFDKFILWCGVWLLARRYFSSPLTAFFVTTTVAATTITYTQNSFPLVMLYSVPLLIFFLHRFFDTFNWMWLFAAAYFFCTVSINIFYFIPIISLGVVVHFLVLAVSSQGALFKGFQIKARDGLWICGLLGLLLILGGVYVLGHDPLIHINALKRSQDGAVPLEVFLTYGGDNGFFKWWEAFSGLSLGFDYTLYMGILAVPLIMVGVLFSRNAHKVPFLWGVLFWFLFASATPVSVLAYHIWPLMKGYRHIAYVAPLIKLYLLFLAGFGFERLFDRSQQGSGTLKISLLCAAVLLCNAAFLGQLVDKPSFGFFLLMKMAALGIQHKVTVDFLSSYFFSLGVLSILASLFFILRPWVDFSKYSASYLLVLLLFHVGTVYWYAFEEIDLRTFALSPAQYHFMDFGKIPFVVQRPDGQKASANPREGITAGMQGAVRNAVNNFTFSDVIKTKRRADFYLEGVNQLFTAFQAEGASPAFLKLVGARKDKIQFFAHAYGLPSSDAVRLELLDKKYRGDMLFYQSQDQGAAADKGLDLGQNQRLTLPYKVLEFSPNDLLMSVDAPQGGVWMQYADAWHPSWKATVNGKPQTVYKGSLAYKALPLQPGKDLVRLYVESKPVMWLYGFFTASAWVWIVLLIRLIWV